MRKAKSSWLNLPQCQAPDNHKKQELSECLRQQQGTLPSRPPHPQSLSHAYPECKLESKDVGQQGSLPLNFSGGSHGSDQFSPVVFFLTSNQSKNAHNSSLILWDEAKSRGRSVRARYPGWPFIVFWLWNFITKYYLKENVFYSIDKKVYKQQHHSLQ